MSLNINNENNNRNNKKNNNNRNNNENNKKNNDRNNKKNNKLIDENRKTNNLINETSPYLLQHAYNPVNWNPWNEKTFLLAKKEKNLFF